MYYFNLFWENHPTFNSRSTLHILETQSSKTRNLPIRKEKRKKREKKTRKRKKNPKKNLGIDRDLLRDIVQTQEQEHVLARVRVSTTESQNQTLVDVVFTPVLALVPVLVLLTGLVKVPTGVVIGQDHGRGQEQDQEVQDRGRGRELELERGRNQERDVLAVHNLGHILAPKKMIPVGDDIMIDATTNEILIVIVILSKPCMIDLLAIVANLALEVTLKT